MYKKLLEFTFFILMITVMVMSLNMAVTDSTGMGISITELLTYTTFVVLIIAILISYPITLIAAVAVAIGGVLYAYFKNAVMPADIINYIGDFLRWLPQYVIGYEAFDGRFALLFAIIYIVLVTLVISLIVFSKKWYGLLIALGTGAFAFFWFIYVSKARLYLFYYLFAALILYSYNVYDRKKLEWVNAESQIDKNIEIKWIFNSLIVIVISILISQFAVLDIKPIQWSWLSEKTLQAFPFIENWRNDNFDSINFGFGSRYGIDEAGYKTARLGGPVKLSERVMLSIETDSTENIYMRGSVKDLYSGNNWSKSKKSKVQYSTDTELPLPFRSTIRTYSNQINISHQNLITSTIFAPNSLSKVQHKIGRFSFDQDNEAVFPRAIVKKDKYTVFSKAPFVDIKELRKVETAPLAVDEYKQLPDNISARVRQLAKDITSRYDNDYDKAKALEKYLRNNYKYSLTPSEVPVGTEFVDYFLFEDKEGYCTYFATSLAVLLRASDIPCRYVEGFLAKYENSYVRNILGTDAHSWVEVNFGEYGWITFEATPAYPLVGFAIQGEVPATPISESDPNKQAASADITDTEVRDKNLDEEDEAVDGEESQQKREIPITTRIILAVTAILLLRVAYLLLKRGYIEYRLRKAQNREYSAEYIKDVLRYTKKIDVPMLKEETMREYWHKVKYALDDQYHNGDEVIALLEKLRYGQEPICEEDRNKLEEYRKKLKRYVIKRLGVIKALISCYILGL